MSYCMKLRAWLFLGAVAIMAAPYNSFAGVDLQGKGAIGACTMPGKFAGTLNSYIYPKVDSEGEYIPNAYLCGCNVDANDVGQTEFNILDTIKNADALCATNCQNWCVKTKGGVWNAAPPPIVI